MKCIRILILLALLLGFSVVSLCQWNENMGDRQPRYMLCAVPDGTYDLVRFSDWKIRKIGTPRHPGWTKGEFAAYFLVVMPGRPKAVALIPASSANDQIVYLQVIDLENGKTTIVKNTMAQLGTGKYIHYLHLAPESPQYVYVVVSNYYNYSSWPAMSPSEAFRTGKMTMARLDPRNMTWKLLKKPIPMVDLLPIPDGNYTLPYMWLDAMRTAKQRSTKKRTIGDLTWQDIQNIHEKIKASLTKQHIIRQAKKNNRETNVMYYGKTYQVVLNGKSLALVKTVDGKSTIISTSSEKADKELSFYRYDNQITIALVSYKLKGF